MTGKPWWQSRTLLGALAVLIALVIRALAPDADVSDQDVLRVLATALDLLGAVLVVVGRVRAVQPIQHPVTGRPMIPPAPDEEE